uniref:Uncharacterized protein n=1 Tax=Meloidogyne enterolobii TaxID=390850 RepID=A0A6V7TYE6_MELEN|nr:unnamed protein product [Meloidogyne enterolobii]
MTKGNFRGNLVEFRFWTLIYSLAFLISYNIRTIVLSFSYKINQLKSHLSFQNTFTNFVGIILLQSKQFFTNLKASHHSFFCFLHFIRLKTFKNFLSIFFILCYTIKYTTHTW